MDNSLSISNKVFAISHAQFQAMVQEYVELIEISLGTACSVEIKAMNIIKWTSTFMHEEDVMEFMAKHNREAVFFECADASELSAETFKSAVYIEVIISPTNKHNAPSYAFAHLEFKGRRPRQATYYLQPADETVIKTLKGKHRFQIIGDGYTDNTDH